MKLTLMTLIAAFGLSAQAVPVKSCPQNLNLLVGTPDIQKGYAKPGFDAFFANDHVVTSDLKLVRTANSECYYESDLRDGGAYQATLKGSLRANAIAPATLVTYMRLPIASKRKDSPVDELVVYFRVAKLSPTEIQVAPTASIYRVGEICSYGECSSDYVYLGLFTNVDVEAR